MEDVNKSNIIREELIRHFDVRCIEAARWRSDLSGSSIA
jgi:hypothetical protein